MNQINRREFMERMAAAAGVLAVGLPASADEQKPVRKITDKIRLGKTDIKCSIVGIGTGTVGVNHSSNQTKLGQEKFTALFRHAFESGITFFDVADSYGSHTYLREAIKGMPREKFVIMTKTFSRNPEAVRADIDRYRKELGVEYIDLLLMHCVTEPDWNVRYRGVKDVIEEAKQNKIVRHHGCSCHSYAAMEAAAADPWVEVDLARFNPWAMYMDAKVPGESKSETCDNVKTLLKRMRTAGKGVIGMKILGQGDAMKGPDRVDKIRESLRWALGSGSVDMMSIGFEAPEQVTQILKETQVALNDLHHQFA